MNSPVDPALLQLVQQEVKFLQDNVNNLSVELDQEKVRVQQELQNAAIIVEEMKQTVERLKNFQGNPICLTSPAIFILLTSLLQKDNGLLVFLFSWDHFKIASILLLFCRECRSEV